MYLQHTCFKKYSLQFYNSRLLLHVKKVVAADILLSKHKSHQAQPAANSLPLALGHSPDVNYKPISIPHLEQGYHWNITNNIQFESGILIPIMQSIPD